MPQRDWPLHMGEYRPLGNSWIDNKLHFVVAARTTFQLAQQGQKLWRWFSVISGSETFFCDVDTERNFSGVALQILCGLLTWGLVGVGRSCGLEGILLDLAVVLDLYGLGNNSLLLKSAVVLGDRFRDDFLSAWLLLQKFDRWATL